MARNSHKYSNQVYQAYGLTISSCIPLKNAVTGNGHKADVTVRYGTVPEALDQPLRTGVRYQAAPGIFLLWIDDIARYLIRDGHEIIIDRMPAADDDDIRLFLLGSAFGALFQQREILALHASAVLTGAGCIAFMGHSGCGKSTVAAAFWRKGFPLVTDDICVLSFQNHEPRVVPGFKEMKLWSDVLKRFDFVAEKYPPARKQIEKRLIPVKKGIHSCPTSLKRIYLLTAHNGDELSLIPVKTADRFLPLRRHTYRAQFLEGLDATRWHLQKAGIISAHVPLVRVKRPRYPFVLDELVTMITADLNV